MAAGVLVDASTIINHIACVVSIGFHFIHLRICLQFNGAGDIVFKNFMLIDKSVNCFKLFITAYRQVHAGGVGLLLFACLIGFSIHLCAILIHLCNNHRSRAIAWISGMAVLLAAGACMLAMKIPQDYAWHSIAVEAILDVVICLESVILVRSKMSEHGGSDNLLRDLIMTSVETLINYWLFANHLVNTQSPWDARNILHLVGSSLAVLIGLGQIGLLAYKAYTHGVFAWEAEMAAGAAADGGDVEQQMVLEEGAEVEEGGRKTYPLFTREVEMAAGAATTEAASDEEEGSS